MYSEQHGSESSVVVAKSIGKCESRGRASVRARLPVASCVCSASKVRAAFLILLVSAGCLRAVAASSSSVGAISMRCLPLWSEQSCAFLQLATTSSARLSKGMVYDRCSVV
jgi:hypothetical protein